MSRVALKRVRTGQPPRSDREGKDNAPGTFLARAEAVLTSLMRYWLAVPLVTMIVYFTVENPSAFLSAINLQNILQTAAPILIMGVATTYILASGAIDLSIGSIVVFSGVLAARYYESNGGAAAGTGVIIIGVILALAGGALCGFINGVLIARFKIPALVATLGSLGAWLGVADLITNGQDITTIPQPLIQHIGLSRPLGIPLPAWIAVAVTIVGGFFLFKSRFGLRTLAIGSDIGVVRRRGINVTNQIIRIYTYAGLLYGLVGILGLAQFSTTAISGHSSDSLNAIAAVVIGGTSLFGGVATMFGTVLGVLIPAVLNDGLVIVGVSSFWQEIVIGIVLCIAVYFDQLQRRRRQAT